MPSELPKTPEKIDATHPEAAQNVEKKEKPQEIGGPKGLEPTRYGDWERNGKCVDF